MKKKISITIEEDLYERVHQIKGKIKISHLCEEALEDFVLRKESLKEYRMLGYESGLKHTKFFSEKEKIKFIDIITGKSRYGKWSRIDMMDELFDRFATKDPKISKNHEDIFNGKLLLNSKSIPDSDGNFPEQAYEYLDGWLDGVMEILNIKK